MATERPLDGQVAVITGGGKGIGRAIALELAGRGARVLVTGRDERSLGETVGEIVHGGGQARHLPGDVRDDAHLLASVQRAVATWGRLDVAVANAGITDTLPLGAAFERNVGRARDMIATNLTAVYALFEGAAAAMAGPGRLIAISSVLGKWGVGGGQAAYCASKAGVHGLVRAAAVELAPRQITCNAVCPGWVETAMAEERFRTLAAEAGKTPEAIAIQARSQVPARRFVEAHEVASLVAFLCSPAAAMITGQAISICGGATTFAG
jgi:NAD(P)-dependent dehydrogenase (short-subunit alcohol dehydrogenase family)